MARDYCDKPFIEDFKQSMRSTDEMVYLNLIEILRYIRNAYGRIHHVITKNIDKIKKPKTALSSLPNMENFNSTFIYFGRKDDEIFEPEWIEWLYESD